jgi:hypothetical protein
MPDYVQPALNQWKANRLYTGDFMPFNTPGRLPGTGTNNVPATGGKTDDWQTPTNVQNDTFNSQAYIQSGPFVGPYVFPFLRCSNYGFSIPSGATILGIQARIKNGDIQTKASGPWDSEIRLAWNASAANLSANTLHTGLTRDVYEVWDIGGPTNMWGESSATLTPTVINSTDFGLVFKAARSGTNQQGYSLSTIRLSVYYSATRNGNVRVSQSYAEVISTVGNAPVISPRPGSSRMVIVT